MEVIAPNKPDPANPAMASRFHCGCPWRGVADIRDVGHREIAFDISGVKPPKWPNSRALKTSA